MALFRRYTEQDIPEGYSIKLYEYANGRCAYQVYSYIDTDGRPKNRSFPRYLSAYRMGEFNKSFKYRSREVAVHKAVKRAIGDAKRVSKKRFIEETVTSVAKAAEPRGKPGGVTRAPALMVDEEIISRYSRPGGILVTRPLNPSGPGTMIDP